MNKTTEKITKEYMFPVAVCESEKATNTEILLKEIGYLHVNIDDSEPSCVVEEGGYIVLDFGREIVGTVRIIVDDECKIRLRTGESYGECNSELGFKGSTNAHSVRDASGILLPAWSDTENFNTAFRFVRIDVEKGTFKAHKVVAGFIHTTIPRTGSFTCADEKINRIYETASHTVTLCMQNGVIWDGVKRDRASWAGDLHSEILAITNLYSDLESVKNTLDMIRNSTKLPQWVNHIPTFSLWWAVCLCEYIARSGDKAIYERSKDYLLALFDQVNSYTSEDGYLATESCGDMGLFLDWPTHEKADEKFGATALLKMTAERVKELFTLDGTKSEGVDEILRKLGNLNEKPQTQKPAIAMCAFASLPSDIEKLLEGGAQGVSVFISRIIFTVLFNAGYKKEACEWLKEYYGGMLDFGATTFWEDFDLAWTENACPITRKAREGEKDIHGDYGRYCYKQYRHSLCHGWSAGIIEFIIEKILGVKRVGVLPGKVEVSPYPYFGDMKGVVPVGNGFVTVEVKDGKVFVEATDGIEVTVK